MNGWRILLEAARGPTQFLLGAMADPRRAQLDLLRRILAANAGSEYGRAHDFKRIESLADYRQAVPVATYDHFSPMIARMAGGESGLLTTAPVVAFEETGGTASGRKLIPYTEASLTAFRHAVLPWLADLARRRPAIANGSVYASISPATRQRRCTPGGTGIGLQSDAAYLGTDLVPAFLALLAVPPEVGLISEPGEWRVETLARLISRADLGLISVWSPTFLLDLVAAIADLADAIEPRIDPEARRRLQRALASGALDTVHLWPRLDAISCWADGASFAFAARLAAWFPQAVIDPKGLLATEAPLTLPFGDAEGSIPALTSCLLEFVDDQGDARLCDELEPGARYRIVTTSWGGFYRYDIGDIVRCLGYQGEVPRLRFEGRAGVTSDLVGEKLDDAFVASALQGLGAAAILVPRLAPKCHYELWVDAAEGLDAMALRVDGALSANPQYAYARSIGQLGRVRALHKTDFMSKILARRVAAGGRLGDTKPVALLCEDASR